MPADSARGVADEPRRRRDRARRALLDRWQRADLAADVLAERLRAGETVDVPAPSLAPPLDDGAANPPEGRDLRLVSLAEQNLEGADLEGARLEGANLARAQLPGANLRGAVLRSALLRGADLSGADLTKADLRGAVLEKAQMERATLDGADMRGVLGLEKNTGGERRGRRQGGSDWFGDAPRGSG